MKKKYPKHFKTRVVKRFAWFPITITRSYISKETRWLEEVQIKQHYVITSHSSKWINDEFIDLKAK
jgi:hypothetical protein